MARTVAGKVRVSQSSSIMKMSFSNTQFQIRVKCVKHLDNIVPKITIQFTDAGIMILANIFTCVPYEIIIDSSRCYSD